MLQPHYSNKLSVISTRLFYYAISVYSSFRSHEFKPTFNAWLSFGAKVGTSLMHFTDVLVQTYVSPPFAPLSF